MKKIAQYVEPFRAHLHSIGQSPHTIKQYVIDLKHFAAFERTQGEVTFVELCQKYVVYVNDEFTSSSAVNRKMAACKKFIRYLADRDLVDITLLSYFSPVQVKKEPLQLLSNVQMKEALAVWPRMQQYADTNDKKWLALRNTLLVYCVAELAIKPAEIVRMKWSHINFQEQTIHILGSKSNRTLPISPSLIELMQLYKAETKLFFHSIDELNDVWLGIGNQQGTPITVKTVERIFQFISKNVGVKVTCTNVRYHALMDDTELDALYMRLGYARKAVLVERQMRLDSSQLE